MVPVLQNRKNTSWPCFIYQYFLFFAFKNLYVAFKVIFEKFFDFILLLLKTKKLSFWFISTQLAIWY